MCSDIQDIEALLYTAITSSRIVLCDPAGVEMLLASAAMLFAFPHAEYKLGGATSGLRMGAIVHAISIKDVINDTVHVVGDVLEQRLAFRCRLSQHSCSMIKWAVEQIRRPCSCCSLHRPTMTTCSTAMGVPQRTSNGMQSPVLLPEGSVQSAAN